MFEPQYNVYFVTIINPFCSPPKMTTYCACKEGGGFGKSCAFRSFNILSITKKKDTVKKKSSMK